MVKFLMNQKLKQDDGGTDQCVNQSRTTEGDSERVTHEVKVQEKVQTTCEGCDIVQSDHAPQAGVAQGIFDGELVRHQGRHQEEVEEELEEEVERRVEREHSSNQKQVRMHG